MDAYGHGGNVMHDDHDARVNGTGHHAHAHEHEHGHGHSPHDDGSGEGGMLQPHHGVGGHDDDGADDQTHEGMLESLEGVGLEHIRFYHESGSV